MLKKKQAPRSRICLRLKFKSKFVPGLKLKILITQRILI